MQWYENENQKLALSGKLYDLINKMKNTVTMTVMYYQKHLVGSMNL